MSKEHTIPFQKGHNLEFPCTKCGKEITFSVFELDAAQGKLQCMHCNQKFHLNDPKLIHQLHLFEDLCRQIQESEEILSNASIGVNIGNHAVEIPFKLLLTRFNSRLKLRMGEDEVIIGFRLEPQQTPVKK